MAIFLAKAKNYVINGAMDFWQRGTSFAAIANNTYFSDRFVYFKSGTMVHTIARSTDVPALAESKFPLAYSAELTLTTPQASLTTNQNCHFLHKLEGQVIAPVYGKSFTLSFWVKAALAGVYAVAFRNNGASRSYVTTVTINQANTWEKKIITVAHDLTGTWLTDTSIGMDVVYTLASGPDLQAPSLNTWLDGNYISHASCVNGVQSGATSLKIAGIQLEEGESSSGFERAGGLAVSELTLCQRYYEKSYNLEVAPGTVSTAGMDSVVTYAQVSTSLYNTTRPFSVRKRTTPLVSFYNPSTGAINNVSNSGGANIAVLAGSDIGTSQYNRGYPNASINFAASNLYYFHWTADAEL